MKMVQSWPKLRHAFSKIGHGKEKPTCKESLVAWRLPKSIMKLDVSFSSIKTRRKMVKLCYQVIKLSLFSFQVEIILLCDSILFN